VVKIIEPNNPSLQPAADSETDSKTAPLDLALPKGFKPARRLEWVLNPVAYLERTHRKSPDFFLEDGLGFGTGPLVITSHPEALQYILSRDSDAVRGNHKTFQAPGEFNRILSPLIGDYSVITLSGDRHRERRQLVTPAFHGDRISQYGQIIRDLTREVADALQPGEKLPIRQLSQQVSLQTIAKVVFGLDNSPRSQTIITLLTEMVENISSPAAALLLFFKPLQKDLGPWSPWGKLLRRQKTLDALIYDEIRDRKACQAASTSSQPRTDILSLLIAARTDTGEALSDQELRDELMALLLAGHETTATAIAWAMYWIHKHPNIRAQLTAELDALGPTATATEIAQQPYLTAVCQETLRRSPVAMFTFPRIAQESITLKGHTFPTGTTFLGCILLTHQRPDLYPSPATFRPERFLERKFSPYEFIPFGNGARRCIGAALAHYELKLAVATLLTHYRFELASSQIEKAKRRGVTLAPQHGVPMVFKGNRT
jgi:cytochrome P450 family 110